VCQECTYSLHAKMVSCTCTSLTLSYTKVLRSYLNLSIRRIICLNFLTFPHCVMLAVLVQTMKCRSEFRSTVVFRKEEYKCVQLTDYERLIVGAEYHLHSSQKKKRAKFFFCNTNRNFGRNFYVINKMNCILKT
jgi:hypothetical protein